MACAFLGIDYLYHRFACVPELGVWKQVGIKVYPSDGQAIDFPLMLSRALFDLALIFL